MRYELHANFPFRKRFASVARKFLAFKKNAWLNARVAHLEREEIYKRNKAPMEWGRRQSDGILVQFSFNKSPLQSSKWYTLRHVQITIARRLFWFRKLVCYVVCYCVKLLLSLDLITSNWKQLPTRCLPHAFHIKLFIQIIKINSAETISQLDSGDGAAT